MNRNRMKWHLVEGPVAYDFTLHLRTCDHFGGVLRRRPLDTFIWALTNTWSRLMARVGSDP